MTREWSKDGKAFSSSGIYCVSLGLMHMWVRMGTSGSHAVYVCDTCGCWSRRRL